jgi:type IV secretion system protein VirB2
MFSTSVLSARNPVAALGYALLAYATSSAVFAGDANPPPADDGFGFVRDFLNNISGLLNAASIVVVTVAIVFAGYQIAFNNKRISEVAPVLIGGVLIGGAAQLAGVIANPSVGTVT